MLPKPGVVTPYDVRRMIALPRIFDDRQITWTCTMHRPGVLSQSLIGERPLKSSTQATFEFVEPADSG